MREIVTFAVGQAGNQIGSAFWETILKEHGLNNEGVRVSSAFVRTDCQQYTGNDPLQLARAGVFFEESGEENKYVPR